VNVLDLVGQESERAFKFAHATLEIADLGFDVHRHGEPVPLFTV
jgi:hypothetical protein